MLALRGHVESRTASKVRSVVILGCKAEIGKLQSNTVGGNQDILGLKVTVVNANRMAELDGFKNLKESVLDQCILTNIESLFSDPREEISLGAEFHDNKGAVGGIQHLHQRHHIRVLAYLVVQLDLSLLESPLSGFEANLVQGLDCILDASAHIKSSVDNAISTNTKNFGQLNASGKNLAQAILGSAGTT